jgi:hypothetical protein
MQLLTPHAISWPNFIFSGAVPACYASLKATLSVDFHGKLRFMENQTHCRESLLQLASHACLAYPHSIIFRGKSRRAVLFILCGARIDMGVRQKRG